MLELTVYIYNFVSVGCHLGHYALGSTCVARGSDAV